MTDQVKSFFSKHGEWIRWSMPFLFIFVHLWAQNNYATKLEFKDLDQRVGQMREVLIRMESGASTDTRHDSLLADHETRIRNLERKTPQ